MEQDWKLSFVAGQPIPDAVAQKLSDLIEVGDLPSGQPLPNENELARRFGVSRSSVRTALQNLQHKGLVEVTRGVGWRATNASPVRRPAKIMRRTAPDDKAPNDEQRLRLRAHLEGRRVIESVLSGLAATYATDSQLQAIHQAHRAHLDCDPDDADGLLGTDELFHRAIAEAAHDPILVDSLAPLLPAVREFRRACFAQERTGAEHSGYGHSTIFDALVNGDSRGAEHAMTAHLMMFASRMGSIELPARP